MVMRIDPPLHATADVVVVGSGSAGSTAAIAAARTGVSVLLVEKLPFLGGTSTAVLDTFYGFYTPGTTSRKVVGGIPDEVVAGLRGLGPVVERPTRTAPVPASRTTRSISSSSGSGS
jgi:NADPH-dependent 2,4-dienoyl-CoA reductase/sulfur reductase-like enzyme